MNGQEENEVKEWVELLNERERTVTDLQNVEFDLATNESHSEYWMRFEIGQHTGENIVNGKLGINLNGANIGYYWRLRTMKTLNNLKMKIMVRAFRIRIKNGEAFEDIAADYPALTVDDLEAIKAALEK